MKFKCYDRTPFFKETLGRNMISAIILVSLFFSFLPDVTAQQKDDNKKSGISSSGDNPLDVVKTIADMVMAKASFDFKYTVAPRYKNVLDKTESKDETSGTAIFTMAIARGVNNKWLTEREHKSSAIKGWNALKTVIEKDGSVHGTVVGTNVNMDVNFYYNRPVADNDTHGLFPLIFAGIEMSRMLR